MSRGTTHGVMVRGIRACGWHLVNPAGPGQWIYSADEANTAPRPLPRPMVKPRGGPCAVRGSRWLDSEVACSSDVLFGLT